jgi:serine/threonine protein kinase
MGEQNNGNRKFVAYNKLLDKNKFPDLEGIVDNVYTLIQGLGKGGFAKVYLSDVDLDKFDYATVAAFREKKTGEATAGIPLSVDEQFDQLEIRIERLRNPRRVSKVKAAVQRHPKIYPVTGQAAVKILDLPVHLSDDSKNNRIERFEREWKNSMGIIHPNFITVYGGGKAELNEREINYYAMEYLPTLITDKNQIINLELKEHLEIIKQAALGLQALHDHGIIHRDVKPQNLLISINPFNIKVSDIGIAKNLLDDHNITAAGIGLGTPHYMSKEQVEAKGDLDIKTDVYSLGATLYSFLNKEKPYADKVGAVLVRALATGEKPRSLDAAKYPAKLIDVVEKMMNPNKDKRHKSMREVAADMDALLRGKLTSVERKGMQRETAKKGYIMERRNGNGHKKKSNNLLYTGIGGGIAAAVLSTVLMFSGGNKNHVKLPKPVPVVNHVVREPTSLEQYMDFLPTAMKLENEVNTFLKDGSTDLDLLDSLQSRLNNVYPKVAGFQARGVKKAEVASKRLVSYIGELAVRKILIEDYQNFEVKFKGLISNLEDYIKAGDLKEKDLEGFVKELTAAREEINDYKEKELAVKEKLNQDLVVNTNRVSSLLEELRKKESKPAAMPEGCVLYLPFDKEHIIQTGDKRIAKDLSGKGNDGIIYGAASVDGIVKEALSFDGKNDYVQATDFGLPTRDRPFTICSWVYPLNDHNGIITFWGSGSKNRANGFRISIGGLITQYFWLNDYHSQINEDLKGRWSYLSVIHNGAGDRELYLNGEKVEGFYLDKALKNATTKYQKSPSIPNVDAKGNLFIGSRKIHNVSYFNGFIDELAIFNRALSEKEIKGLYEKVPLKIIKTPIKIEEEIF